MTLERRFSDDEIRRIFERAAERHDEAERASSRTPEGMTLAQLQDIGQDAGIDPAHVAAAARELTLGEPPSALTVPSPSKNELVGHRTLPVGHLSDAAWEEMVRELRSSSGG